ncbi:MAG: GIY-YIG nuclease family protein [Pseudomonadota bacterium]
MAAPSLVIPDAEGDPGPNRRLSPIHCLLNVLGVARSGVESVLKDYFVYILASRRNGTLYVGVTNNLVRRIWEHKNDQAEGFTRKYSVKTLVWFEHHNSIEAAIQREKRLKRWRRDWKIRLIETDNFVWRDLYDEIATAH